MRITNYITNAHYITLGVVVVVLIIDVVVLVEKVVDVVVVMASVVEVVIEIVIADDILLVVEGLAVVVVAESSHRLTATILHA